MPLRPINASSFAVCIYIFAKLFVSHSGTVKMKFMSQHTGWYMELPKDNNLFSAIVPDS